MHFLVKYLRHSSIATFAIIMACIQRIHGTCVTRSHCDTHDHQWVSRASHVTTWRFDQNRKDRTSADARGLSLKAAPLVGLATPFVVASFHPHPPHLIPAPPWYTRRGVLLFRAVHSREGNHLKRQFFLLVRKKDESTYIRDWTNQVGKRSRLIAGGDDRRVVETEFRDTSGSTLVSLPIHRSVRVAVKN